MMHLVKLSESLDPILYGNKASVLAKLIKLGLNVPRGLVVSSGYINYYLNKDYPEVCHEELINIIPPYPFPDEEIIIRSSSLYEDTRENPAAGLFFSGRCNINNYNETMIRAWESSNSPQVFAFKKRLKLPHQNFTALIIMPYISEVRGGVLFTKHPSSKDMIVNISSKGSEGVTSGYEDSETYYLPSELTDRAKFLYKLYNDARKIEDYFGYPQDIEFLLKDDQNVIYLQSRPIVFRRHCIK